MKSYLAIAALIAITTNLSFAQTPAPAKAKAPAPAPVATPAPKKEEAKEVAKPAAPAAQLATYHNVMIGYEANTYKSINLSSNSTNIPSDQLKTYGWYGGFGIENVLTEFLSTTSTPSFSYGHQSRSTYNNLGTNEVKTYTAKFSQSINFNFGTENFVQPFFDGGLGYGWFMHEANWTSINGSTHVSELAVSGILYEIGVGVNIKFSKGLIPFLKFSIRRFASEDETPKETSNTPGAANEMSIDIEPYSIASPFFSNSTFKSEKQRSIFGVM